METTHTTVKNDQKVVTGYEIKIEGALVGIATKSDKGKFNFKVESGAGKDLADVKTMRDLKVEVAKNVPAAFVAANKPAEKPKTEKKEKPVKGAAAPAEALPEEPAHAGDVEGVEDIELD